MRELNVYVGEGNSRNKIKRPRTASVEVDGLKVVSIGFKNVWKRLATKLFLSGHDDVTLIVDDKTGLVARGYVRNYGRYDENGKLVFTDDATNEEVDTWGPWMLLNAKIVSGRAYPIKPKKDSKCKRCGNPTYKAPQAKWCKPCKRIVANEQLRKHRAKDGQSI